MYKLLPLDATTPGYNGIEPTVGAIISSQYWQIAQSLPGIPGNATLLIFVLIF